MKIVLATHQLPPTEPGGVGLFTVNLAEAYHRLGHDVTILAGSERSSDGPCRLDRIPDAVVGIKTLQLFRAMPGRTALGRFTATFVDSAADAVLRRALQDLRPDVLHVQHTLNLGVRIVRSGIAAGAAVVATVHDYWPICQRIVLLRPDDAVCPGPAGGIRCAECLAAPRSRARGAARLLDIGVRAGPCLLRTQMVQGAHAAAHRLTCPSPAVAATLQQNGFPADRMMVVDYGIPPLSPGVDAAPRPGVPLRVGYIGTLGRHKGLGLALRVAEERRSGAWKLVVHGGPLRDEGLREQLHRLDAAGNVEYRGPFDQMALSGILAELDALVIPSLWPETGPMVLMEAYSAGLPVVGSRLGGLEDRIRHGQDGLLFRAGDPRALGRAIDQLDADYPRFRQGALQRGVRSVEQAAGEFLAVYDEARAAAGR